MDVVACRVSNEGETFTLPKCVYGEGGGGGGEFSGVGEVVFFFLLCRLVFNVSCVWDTCAEQSLLAPLLAFSV